MPDYFMTSMPNHTAKMARKAGFTLIEMSIVLVIIGLIVGGVLVGQDLIRAAAVRAQITQIEKYNTAANTFFDKYGGLPGDLNVSLASQYGFFTTNCTGVPGQRNGDGIIDSGVYSQNATESTEENFIGGETLYFWSDLSAASLIPDVLPTNGALNKNCRAQITSPTPANNYIPVGRLGYGTSVYAYSYNGINWFGLSSSAATSASGGDFYSSPLIPVSFAYQMDTKIDDGIATSGKVQTWYVNGFFGGTDSNGVAMPEWSPHSGTDSATTCYNSTTGAYSINVNKGNGTNCALSFRMRAGD